MARNSDARDTFPYPGGSVVAIISDDAALETARRRLEQAGFGPDRCDVLHGESGLARLDAEGDAHGTMGAIMRRLQAAFSDDAAHMRRYVADLQAGRYVIGIAVGDDEAAKQRAADALRMSRAGFINYYAETYVEDLGGAG